MPFCTPIIFQYVILKNNGGGFAAANKDLRKAVDEGKFRSDLYYRLNVVSVSIPSLRERRDDIRPLAEYFLERYCHRYGIDKTFDDNVFRQLEQYPWPGKLKHLVERAQRPHHDSQHFFAQPGNHPCHGGTHPALPGHGNGTASTRAVR